MRAKFTKILVAVLALFLSGCDDKSFDESTLKQPLAPNIIYQSDNALDYINDYRRGSALSPLKTNPNLQIAARNHANYSVLNAHSGHDESANKPNFTGESPSKRAKFAGYSYTGVLENFAYKQSAKFSYIDAIDGLYSAIYHRFGFLDFSIDEMGDALVNGKKNSAYVFVAGNSAFESFCKKNISDKGGGGAFYKNFCVNQELIMHESRYKNITSSYSSVVKFPQEVPVPIYFSGEEPDPFPECKITANPVSIEFNEKFGAIKVLNFELFLDGKKIWRTKQIDAQNDVNRLFSAHQFALFAYDPFKFGAKYTAVFEYLRGQKREKITWEFSTKTPQIPYFDVNDGDALALLPNTTYEIFFRPKDCNDVSSTYEFKRQGSIKADFETKGTNTITLKLNGLKGDRVIITTDSGAKITAILIKDTPNFAKIEKSTLIKISLIFFGVVLIFFMLYKNMRG